MATVSDKTGVPSKEVNAQHFSQRFCRRGKIMEDWKQDIKPCKLTPPDNKVGKRPLLSIIVPTVDRSNEFTRFLESLIKQEADLSLIELIIVDQNKDSRISEIIRPLRSIKIIYLKIEKISLSYAKNLSIQKINGLFCCYLDDDCWLQQNALNVLLSQLQLLNPFEGLLMKAITPDGKLLVPGKLRSGFTLNEKNLLEAFYAPQISQVYPTSIVKELGGFNENLGIGTKFGSAEDTDLLVRAIKNKTTFKYIENIKIFHPMFNNDSYSYRKKYHYGLGFGALCRIHNFKGYFIVKILRSATGFLLLLPFNRKNSFLHFFTFLGRIRGYYGSLCLLKKIKNA